MSCYMKHRTETTITIPSNVDISGNREKSKRFFCCGILRDFDFIFTNLSLDRFH